MNIGNNIQEGKQNILDRIRQQRLTNSPIIEIDDNFRSTNKVGDVPASLSKEDLILVRSTPFMPKNGEILTAYNANAKDLDHMISVNGTKYYSQVLNRRTVHFSFNGLVKGGFVGAAGWDEYPLIFLEPFKYHEDSSFKGGFIGDSWFDENVKVSKDAIVMIRKDYYKMHKNEFSDEYNYLLFSGDPKTCVKNVILDLGYIPVNHYERIDKYEPGIDEKMSNAYNDYLLRHESMGYCLHPLHSGTYYADYEIYAGYKEAMFEYLRNKKVDVGNEFEISLNEALFFLSKFEMHMKNKNFNMTPAGQSYYNKTTKEFFEDWLEQNNYIVHLNEGVYNTMRRFGIRYDFNENKFYSVGYKDYLKRCDTLKVDSPEVLNAAELLKKKIIDEKEKLDNNISSVDNHMQLLKGAKKIANNRKKIAPLAQKQGIDIFNTTYIDFLKYLPLYNNMELEGIDYGFVYDTTKKKILCVGLKDIDLMGKCNNEDILKMGYIRVEQYLNTLYNDYFNRNNSEYLMNDSNLLIEHLYHY